MKKQSSLSREREIFLGFDCAPEPEKLKAINFAEIGFYFAFTTSGAWMCCVVSLLQPLRRDMRVNLRRDEMRVAEQFLHAAQIRARIQQMRRVTVPQFVRRQTWIQPGDG